MKRNTEPSILVPVDFSIYSQKITQVAGALGATHKARVTLLYVVDTTRFVLPENKLTPGLLPELVSIFEASLEKQAQVLVDTFQVQVSTRVAYGSPVDEILKFVHYHPIDMIVSGIADLETDPKTASASTIVRLAAQASCPVWGLVHSRPEGRVLNKASLIRTKIRLHERIKKLKIRSVRPPVELAGVQSSFTERPTTLHGG